MVAQSGLADLFQQLDVASSTLYKEQSSKEKKGLRIPHLEDALLASETWRPPLKADAKALFEAGHRARPAFCSTAKRTGEFLACGTLKPKVLDSAAVSRMQQPERTFSYPKGFKGYASKPGADLPKPSDDLCSEDHRKWLKAHYTQRDAHLFPTHNAFKKVERLESDLHKSKAEGNTGQAGALQKQLAKAQSAPSLVLRPATPERQTRHMFQWSGPDKASKTLQQAYPWQTITEDAQRSLLAQPLG